MPLTNPIPANAPPYVNASQLARWLGVHRLTVLKWASSGILPRPVRMGPRTLRFDTEAVRATVDKMFEAAGSDLPGESNA
jgi:predicted DNA-binding transcriptional regulator AlpA